MSKSTPQQQNRFAAFSSKERYLLNEGLAHTLKAVIGDINDNPDELENVVEELSLLLGIIREVRDKHFKDEWNTN
jgi:hypothetical protein